MLGLLALGPDTYEIRTWSIKANTNGKNTLRPYEGRGSTEALNIEQCLGYISANVNTIIMMIITIMCGYPV